MSETISMCWKKNMLKNLKIINKRKKQNVKKL